MSCTYEDIVSICDAHGIGLPVDCVEMAMAIVDLAAARAPTLPDQAAEPVTWQNAFDERHEFDDYPDHFMTGMKNEFCAGWHAALKARESTAPTTGSVPDSETVAWRMPNTFSRHRHDKWHISQDLDDFPENGEWLYAAPPANAPAASVPVPKNIEKCAARQCVIFEFSTEAECDAFISNAQPKRMLTFEEWFADYGFKRPSLGENDMRAAWNAALLAAPMGGEQS